jgi:predicted MFS family arabinose efflux permease
VTRTPHRSAVDSENASGVRELCITLGLAAGPVVGLGLARFAYALLLPAMREDLGWSFSVAGAMNTANAAGYLAGAVLAGRIGGWVDVRAAFVGGTVLTALTLPASAASGSVPVLLALRLLAGVAGAISFILGGALVARLGAGSGQGRAAVLLGLYFAGGGAGIALSGLVVPSLLGQASGWRTGWLVLGALAVLAAAAAATAARVAEPPPLPRRSRERWPARELRVLMLAFGLFGAGYIAYMTFIVAFLRGAGATAHQITAFWITLGAAAVVGGFAWGPVLSRLRGGRGPALLLLVVTVGAVLPLASGSDRALFGSAILFGIAFLAVVTAVTTVIRASLPPKHWTPAIAGLTTAFAAGQCVGPILTGALSDGANGVRGGLTFSVGVLLAAMLLALAQPSSPSARGPA